MTVVYSLLILLVVILIHEFGHFVAAKLVGIGVTEFSIGMGPELYTTKKNDTLYSLRLLPAGGYVLLEGDDEDSIVETEDENGKKIIEYLDSDSPTAYRNASIWKRIFVMSFGAVMNFVFAIIVFTIVAINIGVPSSGVGGFVEGLPAEKSGLQVGDVIVKIDTMDVSSWDDVINSFSSLKNNDTADVYVMRDGETKKITVELLKDGDKAIIGIYPLYVPTSLNNAFSSGLETMRTYSFIIFGFLRDVTQGEAGISSLSGPVGIVKEIGNAAKSGTNDLLFFLAYINLNLGIFNLLPVPALDGSKIIFLFIEAIRGKSLSRKFETAVLTVGVFFLIGLMIIVTFRDITSIIR